MVRWSLQSDPLSAVCIASQLPKGVVLGVRGILELARLKGGCNSGYLSV